MSDQPPEPNITPQVPESSVDESPDYDPDTVEQDDTVITTALWRSLAVFALAAVVIGGVLVGAGYFEQETETVTPRAPLEVPQVPDVGIFYASGRGWGRRANRHFPCPGRGTHRRAS